MANGLRIVHLDSSREWRGGQQQLLLLAQGLRSLGCEQVIVAGGGEVAGRLRAAGFEVAAPGRAGRAAVGGAAIAHAHDGHAHTWMLRATLGHQGVRVLSRRVAYPIRNWASRWKYRRLDLVIAVSEQVRGEVLGSGLAPQRVVVIPDGADFGGLPEAGDARARVRRHLGVSAATPAVVCLGAFTLEKGVADLIAALPRMGPDCVLLLPGAGPERAALQRQARRLGVSERLRFVTAGFAADGFTAAEWVAAGDLLAMPSRQEGLGSAALLAMGLGRPVVATTAGGIPEIIENGVTGLLVPPRDATALAAACVRVLGDAGLGARLAAAAGRRARERHDHRALAAATLQAYGQALGAKRKQTPSKGDKR